MVRSELKVIRDDWSGRGSARGPSGCRGGRDDPASPVSERVKSACKPGSVVDSHSSGTRVAARLERPTRTRHGPRHGVPIWPCSEWGLPCHACYQARGALLPHHFTLTGQGPAVYFLWHFPWARAPQALPGTLPCGARTFLHRARRQRLSGRLRGHCNPGGLSPPRPFSYYRVISRHRGSTPGHRPAIPDTTTTTTGEIPCHR